MQIRLTVLGGHASRGGGRPMRRDVLVTAPAGTPLGAVAGALASGSGSGQPARAAASTPALYAGGERLDPKTALLGVPPLVDGALLSLHAPADQHTDPPSASAARLHVVGGPDAGGVHLLQGGQVRVGRSADADVPLDDPDVSRLHCAVTVRDDGRVTVADLRSTNGTSVDGVPVGERPLPLPPGALLRVGESTLRLEPTAPGRTAPPPPPSVPAVPDAEGCLRVGLHRTAWSEYPGESGGGNRATATRPPDGGQGDQRLPHPTAAPADSPGPAVPLLPEQRPASGPATPVAAADAALPAPAAPGRPPAPRQASGRRGGPAGTADAQHTAGHQTARYDTAGQDTAGHDTVRQDTAGQHTARRHTAGHGFGRAVRQDAGSAGSAPPQSAPAGSGRASHGLGGAPASDGGRHGGAGDEPDHPPSRRDTPRRGTPEPPEKPGPEKPGPAAPAERAHDGSRTPGTAAVPMIPPQPSRPPALPGQAPLVVRLTPGTPPVQPLGQPGTAQRTAGGGRFGGVAGAISSWARRLTAGSGGAEADGDQRERLTVRAAALRERWPDAATVLLTALGPGPRLWERGADHPDALTLRLGTADLPAGDDGGTLTAVPFTVCLREPEAFALGLAGPRPRLAGLVRSVLAQAAALHPPSTLELVLVSADRARTAEQRAEEWAWLHWLPHLRPARGQDCRLLLAFDPEQAGARAGELERRLADGPLGASWTTAGPQAVAEAAARWEGPYTLVVVDGDPGSTALGESVARIAAAGPSAGIHVMCAAERAEALAVDCGTVAVLDGDVATTLRVLPHGPERLTLDAVSAAWAERFARALAPLREGDAASPALRGALPRTARLLDELDLALATPSKITARWAAGPGGGPDVRHGAVPGGVTGSATAVLGAGPEGRVLVDLVAEGPHLMAGGAPGSGKTELLRSLAAALAAAERPDRLALVLVDGGGHERGDGLRVCTDLPHVCTYLSASDPVVMREFAQALTAELKRRDAALRDGDDEALLGPVALPRQSSAASADALTDRAQGLPAPAPTGLAAPPRMVVLVDDLDALVAPPLGSVGRPAAGSVVRALEAVARDGGRLGVHLVASTGSPERTAGTDSDERSRLRIALRTLDPDSAALLVHIEDPAELDDTVPGRGYLRRPSGAVVPFQTGRVSGRIPRTATLRPTVVSLDWARMGDPPTRRPLRELGNGPTDLALLASALQRAAESVGADPAPPLL